MSYEQLDTIIQQLKSIESRLDKMEDEIDQINSKTTDIHSNVPFVDWLKNIAGSVSYRLGYEYPENLAISQ